MNTADYQILQLSSINDIDQTNWNALVSDDNPFVKYEFFAALEKGKCIGDQSGWHPQFFLLTKDDLYISAFFAFLKLDSYGEFIFDWEWARAFDQYQIPYYPKLTTAIPYSPITAPKVLGDHRLFKEILLPQIINFYQKNTLSSFHLLFTDSLEEHLFAPSGFKERDSFQYHWKNEEYENFDHFLALLKKNRRKSIKRERRAVESLIYKELNGNQIEQEDLDFFYQSYLNTIDRKYSQAYLSYDFFAHLFKSLPENIVLVQARDQENHKIIGNALYLKSQNRLYGRYWGCSQQIEFLHFELCLYKGIEIAIREKLEVFEAGAQGEHKRMRGFRPIVTKSLHHIKHPQFCDAIFDFIDREKQGITNLFDEFNAISPFKNQD